MSLQNMIELRKKGFFSSEYVAEENGDIVATLSRSMWRHQGSVIIQGKTLTLKKQGVLKDRFTLFEEDTPILEVTQPKAFRHRLEFQYNQSNFKIRDKTWYNTTLLVESEGSTVGSIKSKGLFSSRAIIDLSDNFPLTIRVFIGWIAMERWDEVTFVVAAAGS